MPEFYDVQQNSDEWLMLRSGKVTSSKLPVIMANYGKAFGKPAKNYAVDIAIEQLTNNFISSGFSNGHMERGKEEEPIARSLYEYQTFCQVSNGGFYDCGFMGCSPDGLVGDDGLIEIKSVVASTHYTNIKRNDVDPAYKWQCIGNVKLSDREWIDFVSFCSSFPEDNQLFIHRMYAEELNDEFEQIDVRIEQFKELVEQAKNLINKGAV